MTAAIITFPLDQRLAELEPLGVTLSTDQLHFRSGLYNHEDLREALTAWISTVEADDGQRYTRLRFAGFPTRHYRSEIDMNVAADKYWTEYGLEILKRFEP